MPQYNSLRQQIRNMIRSEIINMLDEDFGEDSNVAALRSPTPQAQGTRRRGKAKTKSAGKGRVIKPDDKRLKANRET